MPSSAGEPGVGDVAAVDLEVGAGEGAGAVAAEADHVAGAGRQPDQVGQ